MEQPYQLHLVDFWGVGLGLVLVFLFFTWRMLLDEARRLLAVAHNRYFMSSNAAGQYPDLVHEDGTDLPVSPDETNSETAETLHYDAETATEIFTLGETAALARLIAAGKVGLTDAVKIGAGAKSGEAYQRRSRQIKEMVEKLKDKYPPRTAEQLATRQALELDKH